MNRITAAKVGAYGIATVAAVASFGHQVHLLEQADLDPLFGFIPSEWVTPLTVDLLAMVALAVRTSDTVTEATRRAALLPLVLAGGLSIAANVAEARNIVQVVVGVWTVAAYILAELFVQKMERKAESTTKAPSAKSVPVTDAEKLARKRAGYRDMTRAEKAAWTKQYRERSTRRTQSVAPRSPGMPPVAAASVEEVEAIAS